MCAGEEPTIEDESSPDTIGRAAARAAGFDIPGAVLGTAGMLLLVYALIRAPEQGWSSTRTIGELATAGVILSRIPVHGTYLDDLLPGLLLMAIGIGAVLVAVTTAANAGVPADKAGLAAGLLNASQQLGTALGLAIFSAIATARTSTLLAAHAPRDAALTAGFHRALLACAVFHLAAAVIALRASNTRSEPASDAASTTAADARGQVPAPELAD